MKTFLIILLLTLFLSGVFLILLDVFRVPTMKAEKGANALIKKQKKKIKSVNLLLDKLADRVSKGIHLSEERREEIKGKLYMAGIEETPEVYVSKKLIKSLLYFLITIPLGIFIHFSFYFLGLILFFISYVTDERKLKRKQKEKREEIEDNLPSFVSHITRLLPKGNPDIIFYFESFLEYASPAFRDELTVTLADMRSGSIENAVLRFEKRVGSNLLSEILRGFMSILRGDISPVFWENEVIKMEDMRRQKARFRAMKIPSKVNKLSLSLYLCFILIWGYVLFSLITESLKILFS